MWPHRWQPTRLPRPWDSPGKNTGVGCHFLLQWMKVKSENWKWSHSVLSDPQQPHGLQPTRFLCPWDFPGKSTGARCHCLLREHHWCFENILDLYWWILFASSCKVSPVRQGTGKKDYARNYLKTGSILFCFSSVQFSSVQSLSHVRLFVTPWIAARQASLSITNSWNSLRFTSIELSI